MDDGANLETLRAAARAAIAAHDTLLSAWRTLGERDSSKLDRVSDLGLLVELIRRRIYPLLAFGALAKVDPAAARDVLLRVYLGEGVDPDRRFLGYTFDLSGMLSDLKEAGGEGALRDLLRHPRLARDRLADPRVIEAVADALEIELTEVPRWLERGGFDGEQAD